MDLTIREFRLEVVKSWPQTLNQQTQTPQAQPQPSPTQLKTLISPKGAEVNTKIL